MSHQLQSSPIDRIETITSDEFYQLYIKTHKPVIITDLATHWPAMQKWSLEFFAGLGKAEFDIERGNVLQGKTDFEKLDFQSYVRELMADEEGIHADSQGKPYLSQSGIFYAFPQLLDDVDFSIFTQHKVRYEMLGWLGPKGTVTGFHFDYADSLLAQISGQKRVQLVSPDQSEKMYPSKKFDYGSVLSQIDARNYDPRQFPLFSEVEILTFDVCAGEMLYIPRGWWHQVESLSASISVNAFGVNVKGVVFDQVPDKIRSLLHRYGLYGKDCTCHMDETGQ